ncbi:LptF/LptG family permease [Fontivita pretiosa]|uniref:LptF/LptG family permease n=1 Tax=Fontivita pretiosa TaxID=2989684 RepID=UPI003D16F1BF
MSSTLFWYIFKDLVRIFLLAGAALSAIMTFGGLLRPLYEHGLDVGQVGQILAYSTPAMWGYSLPIAALYATTVVYGRLGADNEIVACRAAGISHLALTMPAFVLGILTAFISLLLLCFIVPSSTLKVEKVIYSNLAKLVASQIERTHQAKFEYESRPVTVFAQAAEVLPPDPARPRDQAVRLAGPLIVTFEQSQRSRLSVPEEFFMASEATAYIRQEHEDDEVTMSADLVGGTKFPRRISAGPGAAQQNMQVSIGTTRFGPIPLPSPVRENTKFMDIFRLRSLLEHPEQSRRIRKVLREFVVRDQQQAYLRKLQQALQEPQGAVQLDSAGESYLLASNGASLEIRKDRLILTATNAATDAPRPLLTQTRGSQAGLAVSAREMRLRPIPDNQARRIDLELDMLDCVVRSPGGDQSPRANFSRPLVVAMPADIFSLTTRPATHYIAGSLSPEDQMRLRRDLIKQTNSVISEMWARVSFAVSCFILVMVGCALGMMFKSGNFLSAFAISVVPALASIALIVTGQHTCENIPWNIDPATWTNPLKFGLMLIWSGNAAVFALGVVLLARLQRQ